MKILYAEDEKALRQLISMQLEAEFDTEVEEVGSGNQAIEYLKNNSDVDVVISDYNMPDGSGADLYKYMKENMPKLPFILTSSLNAQNIEDLKNFKKDNSLNNSLVKPFKFQTLINIIQNAITFSTSKKKDEKYSKVGVIRFFEFDRICCDVYIKLSDDKFIKAINKNEIFDQSILGKYMGKGCKYLYIQTSDVSLFSENFSKMIQHALETENNLPQKTTNIQLAGVSYVMSQIDQLGISEATIKTINTIIESSISVIMEYPRLSPLLNNMMKKQNYIYEHSLMLAYISGAIAMEMDWHTHTTLEKLGTAALIHDIQFTDPELAKIDKLDKESLKNIDADDINLIKKHPISTVESIKKIRSIPIDVNTIIMQHHENPVGSGFPKGLNNRAISPLSCVFIIAEALTNQLYGEKVTKKKINEIMDSFKQIYDKGNYKKPLEGLLKLAKGHTFLS